MRSFPSRSSRCSSSYVPRGTPFVPPELSWSEGCQARFEERIIHLTASAGLPLSWVENPEWLDFCVKFLLQAKSPSRKVLTRRLLPQALSEFQSKAKVQLNGKNATASCDGWTGENFHHYCCDRTHRYGVRTHRVLTTLVLVRDSRISQRRVKYHMCRT
ncbi:hypothetical protein EDB86DRAFT_2806431 [Lactarius hatsudake]|nr:hypothetical protein EDB86DRAFT_2806431 [Lactarius hatsudake]